MAILIIDDELDVRDSLKALLETAGHSVITAASGKEALEHIKKNDIRLMLVDYLMPGMNGEEFIRKAWSTEHKTPALFITAAAPWQTAGLLSLGVGYIRKPVNLNLLLGTVETYLKKGAEAWA